MNAVPKKVTPCAFHPYYIDPLFPCAVSERRTNVELRTLSPDVEWTWWIVYPLTPRPLASSRKMSSDGIALAHDYTPQQPDNSTTAFELSS